MAFAHFDNINIAAIAGAAPEFVQKIDLNPERPDARYIANFVKQTGVQQRHISITEQTATDLGYVAVNAALERAGWDAKSLDGLVFLTQTSDFNPATGNSCLLHKHLGLGKDVLAFDIAQGCASFPYGLSVCAGLLQAPAINRIAMIIGDNYWIAYPSPEALLAASTFLIGEGTSAVLLEKKTDHPLDIALHTDGSSYHFLYEPSEGARHAWRRRPGILPNGEVYNGGAYMDGTEITSFSTIRVVDDIKQFLARIGRSVTDYDGLVLHQANRQIIRTMAKRLKMPLTKLPSTIEKLANTNGASPLLTIVDAYANNPEKLQLLVSGFGIGLNWGITALAINANSIVPMIFSSHRFDEDFLKPLPL